MQNLLGGALEEGDVIYVHVRGAIKTVVVPSWTRVGVQLGDNGAGAV